MEALHRNSHLCCSPVKVEVENKQQGKKLCFFDCRTFSFLVYVQVVLKGEPYCWFIDDSSQGFECLHWNRVVESVRRPPKKLVDCPSICQRLPLLFYSHQLDAFHQQSWALAS